MRLWRRLRSLPNTSHLISITSPIPRLRTGMSQGVDYRSMMDIAVLGTTDFSLTEQFFSSRMKTSARWKWSLICSFSNQHFLPGLQRLCWSGTETGRTNWQSPTGWWFHASRPLQVSWSLIFRYLISHLLSLISLSGRTLNWENLVVTRSAELNSERNALLVWRRLLIFDL